jgi:hypothetical protein
MPQEGDRRMLLPFMILYGGKSMGYLSAGNVNQREMSLLVSALFPVERCRMCTISTNVSRR